MEEEESDESQNQDNGQALSPKDVAGELHEISLKEKEILNKKDTVGGAVLIREIEALSGDFCDINLVDIDDVRGGNKGCSCIHAKPPVESSYKSVEFVNFFCASLEIHCKPCSLVPNSFYLHVAGTIDTTERKNEDKRIK